MINKDFKSILELLKAFPTEQSCIDHLDILRWNGNVISPFDSTSKVYKCKGNKYRCKNTGKYFNVRTDTLFDNTKVKLQKWFLAIYLVTSHKKGISSLQLAKDIDVTQKTAWFMLQRIRNCFGIEDGVMLDNVVEVDETFVGGKNKNRHKDKKVKYSQGRSFKDKTPVIGAIERGGRLIAKAIPSTSREHLHGFLIKHVKRNAKLMSDEWKGYNGLKEYYNHTIVDHSAKQYVDGDTHCNTVEGFWSILKRGFIGIYHFTSRKHLQKYVDEFVFRYNTRDNCEATRFNLLLTNTENRLTYKELIHDC